MVLPARPAVDAAQPAAASAVDVIEPAAGPDLAAKAAAPDSGIESKARGAVAPDSDTALPSRAARMPDAGTSTISAEPTGEPATAGPGNLATVR
ncbi:hypothetical protein AB0F91_38980 [Amycolatopsis sp. NPDC023774]|uniref:hypothetical protein n=1 Tax=Amycolatopsis sp. NPDC023774 TaxID=3155015 RepID=UPI003404AA55